MKTDLKKGVLVEAGRRKERLAGSASLRSDTEEGPQTLGNGQIACVFLSSYGASIMPAFTGRFEQAGSGTFLSPMVLLETQKSQRQVSLQSLSPAMRAKVVAAEFPGNEGGMLHGSIPQVLANKSKWLRYVEGPVNEWLTRVEAESDPVMCLLWVGPGGTAGMGIVVAEAWRKRFPDKPLFVITILDRTNTLRQRFPELRRYYRAVSRGMILMDNMRFPNVSDVGLVDFLAASVAAEATARQGGALYNGFADMFPEDEWRVATISTWAETVPRYTEPPWEKRSLWEKVNLPGVDYTSAALLEEKGLRCIHELLSRPELQSVARPAAPLKQRRLLTLSMPVALAAGRGADYGMATIEQVARRIMDAASDLMEADPDLSIEITSIAISLGPNTREIPLVGVVLQLLDGQAEDLDDYAVGATPKDPTLLPSTGQQPNSPAELAAGTVVPVVARPLQPVELRADAPASVGAETAPGGEQV